ncbi:unnamed protein product [Rhizophagus irregularis]|nr:unnamed protein product [Rhizophagus irregularis]
MEDESSEDTQTSEFTHDDCSNIGDEMKRSGKGRPLGTKRFKSSTEAPKPKSRNQRNCRKCGKVGHYQKNCKEQEI